MEPYYGGSFTSYYGQGGVMWPQTNPIQFPTSYVQSFSFGGILEDLGDWIKTTGGEVLRVVVDEFGRRVVQKTGEVLSGTPIGTSTTYYTARNTLQSPAVLLGIGAVALLLLAGRR